MAVNSISQIRGAQIAAAPEYISSVSLSAGVGKVVSVPASADVVVFRATGPFWVKRAGAAVIPLSDVTDGSAPELNPQAWMLNGVNVLGLIAAADTVVTMSWFKLRADTTVLNPQAISGLAIWLDASDTNTVIKDSSDLVTRWADKSGNGNDAIQLTTANKPKWMAQGVNGRPAVEGRWDGSTPSQLNITDNPTLDYTGFTQFAVFQRVTDLGASEHIAGKYLSTTGQYREQRFYIESGDFAIQTVSQDGTGTALANAASNMAVPVGTPFLFTGSFTSGIATSRLNLNPTGIATNNTAVFNGPADYTFFGRDALQERFAGRIAEYLFFTRLLTKTEQDQVSAYLAAKWLPESTFRPEAQFVTAMQSAGLWNKADAIYLFAEDTQAAALKDAKGNAALDMTAVGSPDFVPGRGFHFDGTASHLIGPAFSSFTTIGQNDHCFAVFTTTGVLSAAAAMATDSASQGFLLGSNDGTHKASVRSAAASTDTIDIPDGTGLLGVSRTGAAGYDAYINKTKNAIVRASATFPTTAKLTFGRAGASTFNAVDVAFGAVMKGLTQAEWNSFNDIVVAYLTAKGVISPLNGIWSWFNDPRVIAVDSKILQHAVSSAGSPVVITNQGSAATLITSLEMDDHDAGAILRNEATGELLAYSLKHNATEYYQSRSTDNGVTWGAAVDIMPQLNSGGTIPSGTAAYAAPFYLPGESGKMMNFFRIGTPTGPNWGWGYSQSTNGGTTWGPAVAMTPTGANRPYMKAARLGPSRIDVFMNDGHPADIATNSLYHFYYDNSLWKKSDGTALGAFPLTPGAATMTRIYDGSGGGGRSWIWDAGSDPATKRPVAAFATFPTTSDHRYYQARYNGTAWVNSEVCTGGDSPNYLYAAEPYYSGGIALDPDNVNQVFVSRRVGTIFQIFKYVFNGTVWTGTQLTNDTQHNFRPYIIRGTRTMVYCRGRYSTYSDYNTRIQLMTV